MFIILYELAHKFFHIHYVIFCCCYWQHDMQRAVEIRFRDTSTLVREAAVDVIGRFVLCKPELTLQYYDMICERIRVSPEYLQFLQNGLVCGQQFMGKWVAIFLVSIY